MTELRKIWIEQCEAARGIEDEFGTQKALASGGTSRVAAIHAE